MISELRRLEKMPWAQSIALIWIALRLCDSDKKGLHDPSRDRLIIVFVFQNTRGNTRRIDTFDCQLEIIDIVNDSLFRRRVILDASIHVTSIIDVLTLGSASYFLHSWYYKYLKKNRDVLQSAWSHLRAIDDIAGLQAKIKSKITLDSSHFKVRLACSGCSIAVEAPGIESSGLDQLKGR